jgi:hypothetical protein
MKKLFFVFAFFSICAVAFSGTVTGSLLFPTGAEGDTFMCIVANNLDELLSVPIVTAGYPELTFTVDWAFDDTVDYFALAILPRMGIPQSGDPCGMYPNSPFRTTGGNYSGIVIPIDSTCDLRGRVNYRGSFDNVFINVYGPLPRIFHRRYSSRNRTRCTHITIFNIPACPSGPKLIVAYVDANGNGRPDDDEIAAMPDNFMGGLVISAGGMTDSVIIDLAAAGAVETKTAPSPSAWTLHQTPSMLQASYPFHSLKTEMRTSPYTM